MKIILFRCWWSYSSYFIFFALVVVISCNQSVPPVQVYLPPGDRTITLQATTDTLHFALDPDVYSSVRSFNHYNDQGKSYIAFHDKVSGSVSIYDFSTCALIKKIKLKKLLPYRSLGKKTSVYIKNNDSLFICNKNMIYLFNGELQLVDSVALKNKPYVAYASFKSQAPPFFHNGKLYLRTSPYLSAKKKKEYQKWMSLYELDFNADKARLLYPPPKRYQDSLYGYYFFDASYCINNNNRIVFSFPADSNLYETDLLDFHVAHNAKSRYYEGDIMAVADSAAGVKDGMRDAFLLRDSYGDVYFDPGAKRYLRVAAQKLTERDLLLGTTSKEKNLLVLDEQFRTIGEGKLPRTFSLSTLFITPDGRLYVRVRASDQNNIHLARLTYQEDSTNTHLARHP